VGKRVLQPNTPSRAGVKDRVREHQFASPRADIELDHVDPDLERRVKRRQRIARRQRAGASVPDSLTRACAHLGDTIERDYRRAHR
jgi:hypothetical protein